MKINVEIAKECSDWDQYPEVDQQYFAEIAKNILSRYSNFAKVKEFELSILLTDDAKMQSLNKEFRGKNNVTNVLSFPDLDIYWKQILEFPVDPYYIYVGDIAFGCQIIADEAQENYISFQDHFKHLTIHAILHLIGYDHIKSEDAKAMEALEVEILKDFNIVSPY